MRLQFRYNVLHGLLIPASRRVLVLVEQFHIVFILKDHLTTSSCICDIKAERNALCLSGLTQPGLNTGCAPRGSFTRLRVSYFPFTLRQNFGGRRDYFWLRELFFRCRSWRLFCCFCRCRHLFSLFSQSGCVFFPSSFKLTQIERRVLKKVVVHFDKFRIGSNPSNQ